MILKIIKFRVLEGKLNILEEAEEEVGLCRVVSSLHTGGRTAKNILGLRANRAKTETNTAKN